MRIATVLGRSGLLISCTFLLASQAPAAVLFVNLNNPTPTAPYADWSTAATNIQDAVDAASIGDTILVTNGVYQTGGGLVAGGMTNRVVVSKAITVSSVNGPGVTAIWGYQAPGTQGYVGVGDAAIRCVYLANGATLMGFTMANGATRYSTTTNFTDADNAGGVFCQSGTCALFNCIITNNMANASGGGVYQGCLTNCAIGGNSGEYGGGVNLATLYQCAICSNKSGFYGGGAYESVLNDCTLTGNFAYQGGAVAQCNVTNCTLTGNSTYTGGGGAYQGTLSRCTLTGNWVNSYAYYGGGGAYSATLDSCVLNGNQAVVGGGVTSCSLTNCTLVGNFATNSGGGALASSLNNCIVYFNTTSASNANFDLACTLNYCCTTPLPSNGVGNITSDPQLAGTTHITALSPCRGAGNTAYTNDVDLDGQSWLNPPAIGCNEYHADSIIGPLTNSFTLSYTSVLTGFTVNFAASIQGESTVSTWDFSDGIAVTNELYVSHFWSSTGDYPVTLTAFNQSYPGGVASTVIVHVVPQPVYYVDLNNESPAVPYTSWASAATNIQDAVDQAFIPGALVMVNDGHYQSGARAASGLGSTNRVVVTRILTIQSVNGPTVTSIDGGNAMGGVYLTNGAALVGFTVWNCSSRPNPASAGVWSATGGAVVSNCIFTLNPNDGGAYNVTVHNSIFSNGGGAGTCKLYNCLITNCPGGLFGCTANNCLIVNNFTTDGGGANGCTLNNCTLVGNAADNIGGGAYHSTLNNCISYYNWGLVGSNYDSTCTLNNCCTWPLPATGVGNFTNAPAFMNLSTGDFRLQSNSPCINAGINGLVVGSTDFAGNPRISGGTVDVGAYEFQNPASIISYAWLEQYGLPTDGSADFADTDGDGMNTYQEWRAGTDPTNPLSVFKLLNPYTSGTNMIVLWTTVPNRSYYLQRSSDLGTPGSFSTIASGIPGVPGTMFYVDTNAPAPASVFYRVGVQ